MTHKSRICAFIALSERLHEAQSYKLIGIESAGTQTTQTTELIDAFALTAAYGFVDTPTVYRRVASAFQTRQPLHRGLATQLRPVSIRPRVGEVGVSRSRALPRTSANQPRRVCETSRRRRVHLQPVPAACLAPVGSLPPSDVVVDHAHCSPSASVRADSEVRLEYRTSERRRA